MKLIIIFIIILVLFLYIIFTSHEKYITSQTIPKIIWTFWDSDDIPFVVQECIETWVQTNPDYIINILSRSTLHKFLPNNNVFSFRHCINNIQKATDFIRLQLLYKYGGFWLDATIILNGSLNYFLNKFKWLTVKYQHLPPLPRHWRVRRPCRLFKVLPQNKYLLLT